MDTITQKRFYSRETNGAAFCIIQQMSIKTPLPSMQLKWLSLFEIKSAMQIKIFIIEVYLLKY